jgi:pyranose oxidase
MDRFVFARAVVIACGAIGTPQVLYNSNIRPHALGRYLTEQSLSFCQIVMKRELIEKIATDPRWAERVAHHKEKYPNDPLPIPFTDPEPQVNVPYRNDFPYHVQVHRDAFSYGDVGPKADSRVIVDLRFFGRQDISEHNFVYFGPPEGAKTPMSWTPGLTDSYGMPQPTFEYRRSDADNQRDQDMMRDMCTFASVLGSYLPGSYPQFMAPGLALHICGTTRIGKDKTKSVADANSKVHDFQNLWVGGNGTIPDSTACNPTLTSLAIAIKGSESLIQYLDSDANAKSKA